MGDDQIVFLLVATLLLVVGVVFCVVSVFGCVSCDVFSVFSFQYDCE